jgi:ATP-binding cassette subfamily C (CFTR/MRP) protein 2
VPSQKNVHGCGFYVTSVGIAYISCTRHIWHMLIALTPGGVLSSIATFVILRQPLQFFPELASLPTDARVSLHRLWLFLQEPELPADAVEKGGNCELDDVAIEVGDGVFSWNVDVGDEHLPPTLHGVNFRIRKRAHVAVCRQVGSGKSALLAYMLGEIPKLEGTVRLSQLSYM